MRRARIETLTPIFNAFLTLPKRLAHFGAGKVLSLEFFVERTQMIGACKRRWFAKYVTQAFQFVGSVIIFLLVLLGFIELVGGVGLDLYQIFRYFFDA